MGESGLCECWYGVRERDHMEYHPSEHATRQGATGIPGVDVLLKVKVRLRSVALFTGKVGDCALGVLSGGAFACEILTLQCC